MDPMKAKAMAEWPSPSSLSEVRSFLGIASFYRKFIRNFGAVSAAISDCLRKGKFNCTLEAEVSF